MLTTQKDKFRIPSNVTYLNGAYMAPSLKSVEKAGHEAITQKCFPYEIGAKDFFIHSEKLRKQFAAFVEAPDFQNTAIIPSASYGLANVAKNVKLQAGDEIIIIDEQFPSNVYAWKKLAEAYNASIKVISAPKIGENRAFTWNENILNSISSKTALVAMPPIHWADGTLYDLINIREKTEQYNALLIIDGSQSVGALPFSVKEIDPDALICAGYKWLFGPYGCAYAYYGSYFDSGIPIEENWTNRLNSENFAGLTNYESNYKPLANKYNVGESGNFIYVKMQIEALKQVIEWTPKAIQDYCKTISVDAVAKLKELGCTIEDDNDRSHHLFGIKLPEALNIEALKKDLTDNNIYVSFRGNYIRISCHLYNTKDHFKPLIDCLSAHLVKA